MAKGNLLRASRLLLCGVVLTLVLASCGDGGGEDPTATLTKAEYLEKADAICTRTEQKQAAALQTFGEEHGPLGSRPGEEEVVIAVGLPPLRAQIEEIEGLSMPAGDEKQLGELYDQWHRAIKAVQANPSSILRAGPTPFTLAEQMARTYGFRVCGGP